MIRSLSVLLMLSFSCLTLATEPEESFHRQTVAEIDFEVAVGLQVVKVAGEPLVKWPVVADWDAEGRLVLVESGGVARPIQQHNEQRLHRVVRLIDEDGDGVFDRRVVAADGLPFAEGVLCLGKKMLVAAPPNIWELTDEDGDGICESRTVWFDGQTITNCANDLHGPYLGRDGWIYWCKGAFAEQTHKLMDGSTLKDRAAHIFRRRLEGGPIEPLISGGMDNPVELAFTPEGEKFFTSTFLQHPGDGKRDGLGHAVYGSVFGKDHDVLDQVVRTGPLMPIMTHLGPAAPSGLICLEKEGLTFQQLSGRVLVSAQFNLHKVAAHRLLPNASASWTTSNADLLRTEQVDFHPTDVLEDADGSLLVVDTGGWYDLCCPTSRVDQKVASGGIYRLRASGQPEGFNRQSSVDWQSITVEECIRRLSDDRPWVQREAFFALREFGLRAVPFLQATIFDEQQLLDHRLDAVWGLSWLDRQEAWQVAANLLEHATDNPGDLPLRKAAAHVLGLHRYQAAGKQLERLLDHPDPHLQRIAAKALGRIGDPESIARLMSRLAAVSDQQELEHALLFALIEIGNPEQLAKYLESDLATQQRAALVALDQLQAHEQLHAKIVLQAAASNEEKLRTAAVDVLTKHPEWAEQGTAMLEAWWRGEEGEGLDEKKDEAFLSILRAWREESAIQNLVAGWLESLEGQPNARIQEVLAAWNGLALPSSFVAPMTSWLQARPVATSRLLQNFRLPRESAKPLIAAIHAAIKEQENVQAAIQLVRLLPAGESVSDRRVMAELIGSGEYEVLADMSLSERQARELSAHVVSSNARELPDLLRAISSAKVDSVDRTLLKQLYALPVARTLDANILPNLYRDRSPELKQLAQEINDVLQLAPKNVRDTVAEVLRRLPAGDPVRGLQVFRGTKSSCSACHQMGYLGGRIGPELTRIGKTRTREALLEAILFPSSRIEQSFRPTKVLTIDGQVINGLVTRASGNELELQVAADKKVVVELDEVEVQQPSEVSIMPSGMLDVLTPQELADLLALLESAQ